MCALSDAVFASDRSDDCMVMHTKCGDSLCPQGTHKLGDHICQAGVMQRTEQQASCRICPSALHTISASAAKQLRDETEVLAIRESLLWRSFFLLLFVTAPICILVLFKNRELRHRLKHCQDSKHLVDKDLLQAQMDKDTLEKECKLLVDKQSRFDQFESQTEKSFNAKQEAVYRQESDSLQSEVKKLQKQLQASQLEAVQSKLSEAAAISALHQEKHHGYREAAQEAVKSIEWLRGFDGPALQAAISFAEQIGVSHKQSTDRVVDQINSQFERMERSQRDMQELFLKALSNASAHATETARGAFKLNESMSQKISNVAMDGLASQQRLAMVDLQSQQRAILQFRDFARGVGGPMDLQAVHESESLYEKLGCRNFMKALADSHEQEKDRNEMVQVANREMQKQLPKDQLSTPCQHVIHPDRSQSWGESHLHVLCD